MTPTIRTQYKLILVNVQRYCVAFIYMCRLGFWHKINNKFPVRLFTPNSHSYVLPLTYFFSDYSNLFGSKPYHIFYGREAITAACTPAICNRKWLHVQVLGSTTSQINVFVKISIWTKTTLKIYRGRFILLHDRNNKF